MNRNTVLLSIIGLALVALGVFAWYTTNDSGEQPSSIAATTDDTVPVISADYERTLGSPKAPIKMIEYAAPMCPVCANFNKNEFPKLKSEYIDTGKVYYIFRVFPIGNPDYGVEGLARCLPKAQYFPFLDMMYRNQDKWDPDGHDIPDVRAAILAMATTQAALPADRAARCIDDKDTISRTTKIAQDATARYGVNGTPTFIVDGAPVYSGEYPWDQLKAMLDAKLPR